MVFTSSILIRLDACIYFFYVSIYLFSLPKDQPQVHEEKR